MIKQAGSRLPTVKKTTAQPFRLVIVLSVLILFTIGAIFLIKNDIDTRQNFAKVAQEAQVFEEALASLGGTETKQLRNERGNGLISQWGCTLYMTCPRIHQVWTVPADSETTHAALKQAAERAGYVEEDDPKRPCSNNHDTCYLLAEKELFDFSVGIERPDTSETKPVEVTFNLVLNKYPDPPYY